MITAYVGYCLIISLIGGSHVHIRGKEEDDAAETMKMPIPSDNITNPWSTKCHSRCHYLGIRVLAWCPQQTHLVHNDFVFGHQSSTIQAKI